MSLPATQGEHSVQQVYTKAHKAAIVLAALSPEIAAEIVEKMSDDHLRTFARTFSGLKGVSPSLLDAIASEFVDELDRRSKELAGGPNEARRVLGELTDEERLDRIFGDAGDEPVGEDPWPTLEEVEDDRLADYLSQQRPAIAAAVLLKFSEAKTASILSTAPKDFADSILLAMSKRTPAAMDVLKDIGAAMAEELLKGPGGGGRKKGAVSLVAEVVNLLPGKRRDAFLKFLGDEDPDVCADVRQGVITFAELHARLPANAATVLLREVENADLLNAIKFGETNAPETVAYLFGNISKRMVDQYKEDLANLAMLSVEDGEAAQREITKTVRRLEKAGEITVFPASDN